jgi:flagellar basal-body rod protein FlgC
MNSAMSISASGIGAATTRLNVAASNVANMQTSGPVPATPPSQSLPQTPGGVYQAKNVQQTTTPNGGVATSLSASLPSYIVAYDPGSAQANSQGMVVEPNVDVATQYVNMSEASAAVRASIAVFKAADKNYQLLLDVIV